MSPEVKELIRDAVKDELLKSASRLLTGRVENLAEFASEMTQDAVACLEMTPSMREALLVELGAQVRAVAERNRLSAVADAWEEAQRLTVSVLQTGIRVGLAVAAGAA